jgi:hypothetical protein
MNANQQTAVRGLLTETLALLEGEARLSSAQLARQIRIMLERADDDDDTALRLPYEPRLVVRAYLVGTTYSVVLRLASQPFEGDAIEVNDDLLYVVGTPTHVADASAVDMTIDVALSEESERAPWKNGIERARRTPSRMARTGFVEMHDDIPYTSIREDVLDDALDDEEDADEDADEDGAE